MSLWSSSADAQVTAVSADVMARWVLRAGRATPAGLLGIMEMEEIELDAAATATLSHLANASAFGATGGRPPAAGFVDDLLGLVSGGYLLGRIVLGTTFVRARYSGTEIEAETNMVRLLGHVKLISNPEIEQLVAGAVQDAVDELAGPALRRRSSLRKAISASRAIDLVYDALDDGLKTALVEEALFDLLPSAQ